MLRLLRLAFWSALVFAFVMAVLPRPPQLPGQPSDKIQHILAFLTLTALALAAYRSSAPWRIGAGLAAFGVLIELCQAWPPLHRDASVLDWLADCGAIFAILAVRALWF